MIYAGLIIFKLLKYFISGVTFKMTSQGESQVPVLTSTVLKVDHGAVMTSEMMFGFIGLSFK